MEDLLSRIENIKERFYDSNTKLNQVSEEIINPETENTMKEQSLDTSPKPNEISTVYEITNNNIINIQEITMLKQRMQNRLNELSAIINKHPKVQPSSTTTKTALDTSNNSTIDVLSPQRLDLDALLTPKKLKFSSSSSNEDDSIPLANQNLQNSQSSDLTNSDLKITDLMT